MWPHYTVLFYKLKKEKLREVQESEGENVVNEVYSSSYFPGGAVRRAAGHESKQQYKMGSTTQLCQTATSAIMFTLLP